MSSSDLVQSLSRGLSVLQVVAAADDGLGLAQVCDATGLKPPTAHNLLRTLAAHGYVEKANGAGRYRLGPAVGRLADQRSQRSLARRVEEAMRSLALRFPAVRWSYAEPVGGEVIPSLRIDPEHPGQPQRDRFPPMPPYTSASALLHQAFWPAEARQAFARRYPFAEFGGHVWSSPDRLDAYLDQVRAAGYAEPRLLDDHYRIAAAVFTPAGRFAGALGAYLPDAWREQPEQLPALRDAVRDAAEVRGQKPKVRGRKSEISGRRSPTSDL